MRPLSDVELRVQNTCQTIVDSDIPLICSALSIPMSSQTTLAPVHRAKSKFCDIHDAECEPEAEYDESPGISSILIVIGGDMVCVFDGLIVQLESPE